MYQLLPGLALIFVLAACAPATPTDRSVTPAYFELAAYIDAEVERLTNDRQAATKTIVLNGQTESQQLTDINYANDLRLFREADINKPAWSDKYAVTTTPGSVGHLTTVYRALDSTLTVHKLLVEEDQGTPVRIEIERRTGSVLSDGKHLLVYQPAVGYRVETVQENRFGDDVAANISVAWR